MHEERVNRTEAEEDTRRFVRFIRCNAPARCHPISVLNHQVEKCVQLVLPRTAIRRGHAVLREFVGSDLCAQTRSPAAKNPTQRVCPLRIANRGVSWCNMDRLTTQLHNITHSHVHTRERMF